MWWRSQQSISNPKLLQLLPILEENPFWSTAQFFSLLYFHTVHVHFNQSECWSVRSTSGFNGMLPKNIFEEQLNAWAICIWPAVPVQRYDNRSSCCLLEIGIQLLLTKQWHYFAWRPLLHPSVAVAMSVIILVWSGSQLWISPIQSRSFLKSLFPKIHYKSTVNWLTILQQNKQNSK